MEPPAPVVAPPWWGPADDQLTLRTIGVDVGSATCQLVVSMVAVQRVGGRYQAVSSRSLHTSAVGLTPYRADGSIDAVALGSFFSAEMLASGTDADAVDSGVVILTGAALERRNARSVAEALALRAGVLVSVAAGDHLESVLAAHGSGAVAHSREHGPVLNIDIGGGTTKLALCVGGAVAAVTAIDVGGRLVVWDDDQRVVRLERAASLVAARLGLELAVGRRIEPCTAAALADAMAGAVLASAAGAADSLAADLHRMPPLPGVGSVCRVVLSGGVAELVEHPAPDRLGDLGPLLATSLSDRMASFGAPVACAATPIRATVMGASRFSVQVSGPTIHAERGILPLRNLAVVPIVPSMMADRVDGPAIAEAVASGVRRHCRPDGVDRVAVFVPWRGSASADRLEALADALVSGLQRVIAGALPVVVVCDRDVGAVVGRHLRERLPSHVPLVILDGVELRDFDYVDIGQAGEASITVTIKSLLFPGGAAGSQEVP